MGWNMNGVVRPKKVENLLKIDSEIKKKKKTNANFDNLFPTTKKKAWDWETNEKLMFGDDIFV